MGQDKAFKDAIAQDILIEDALDVAVGWIGDNMEPEEVFDDSKLSTWAYNNGFVKED